MQLIHIKMKNGEDLLGYLASNTEDGIEIMTPISVILDPTYGMFAKSWLMLSDLNSVWIKSTDYMFFSTASRKATEYYDEFMHRISEKEQQQSLEEDLDFTSELEEIFQAMSESRLSKKH